MRLHGKDQLLLVKSLLSEGLSVKKIAQGNSMLPTIPDGALVELRPVEIHTIKLGDVIFFSSAHEQPLIHRVAWRFKRRQELHIQTWGDNNNKPDHSIPCSQVYGRVIAFEKDEKQVHLRHQGLTYCKYFIRRYGFYYAIFAMAKIGKSLKQLLFTF